MRSTWITLVLFVSTLLALCPDLRAGGGSVSGPRTRWQTLTIDFAGPTAGESDDAPNPFLDYRLDLTFTGPSGQTLLVPGFFDGDGAGGGTGSVWRVRFTPDEGDTWSWSASFRSGPQVAIDANPLAGSSAGFFDGQTGQVEIAPSDPNAPGLLKWGRLERIDAFYPKFRDGPFFLKGGVDSPENFLGYSGFDNTPEARHDFPTHAADWQPGDPDWDRADPPGTDNGRAIIGALNYLASKGANSIYFLPMNIGGDGKDTWPFVGPIDPTGDPANDNLHYDISKLTQWEIVLAHAQRLGIHLHFVLNEAESPNKQELDNAALGVERKLFYREIIARFAHHNAVQWNISEEYNLNLILGVSTVLQWAAWISMLDPYDHPVTVHNAGNPRNTWDDFLGQPDIDLTSLQYFNKADGLGEEVEWFRDQAELAGRRIPIMIDEPESVSDVSGLDFVRKRMLWDIYLSGGGVEWYDRTQDQSLEDFRSLEQVWEETFIARMFVEALPFQDMTPADDLLTGESAAFDGGEVLALPGEVYALFLPDASPSGTLDLSGETSDFELRWFDPRTGNFVGSSVILPGGAASALGPPPSDPDEDWAALVQRVGPIDCNNNGVPDADDIANGTSSDCNANGVPDECEPDCNGNGLPDDCDIADGAPDCNGNGLPDACDIASGASSDCNANGVPNECEADCDDDGFADACELAASGGLVGTYYNDLDFQGSRVARIDPVVLFDWGAGGPAPGVAGDTFSCRWTGWVLTPPGLDGEYTFFTTTNDGARLFVDGVQLIDQWMDMSPTEHAGSITLRGGRAYRIRMEHYEGVGTAVAELRWDPPGAAPKEVIPETSLRPALDCNANGVPDACDAAAPGADLNENLVSDDCDCAGDLDGDRRVNAGDLSVLLSLWGGSSPLADIDGSGTVGPSDLSVLLAQWERCD